MAGGNASIQMNDANIPDGGPSFFMGAPLSKSISVFVVAFFVFGEIIGLHQDHSNRLDWERILNDGELWRLVTCQLTFETIGVLLFGLAVLCPMLRRFEREMGSRRFGSFVVFSSTISTLLELVMAQMLPHSFFRASGPYGLLGGLLYLYHGYTPRLHPKFFGMLGFDFSEKAVQYALVFQLLYADGWSAVVPFSCGTAGAFLCTTPPLRLLERYELPNFLYSLARTLSGPFVETPPTPMRQPNPFLNSNGARQQQRQALRPAAMRPPPTPQFPVTPPASEEMIESLTSMGFERDAVIRTLQQCDNNVEVAANRLLSAS